MPRLTRQELVVLKLAAQGMTNAQIGHRTNLATATVAGHLHQAYGKLGVDNRVRAIVVALGRGYLTMEDLTGDEAGGGPRSGPARGPARPPH